MSAKLARTSSGIYAVALLLHQEPHPVDGKYCCTILLINDQVRPASTTLIDASLTMDEILECIDRPGSVHRV